MEIYSHPTFDTLMQIKSNQICFDCSKPNPDWVSLNNGVYLCLDCAGQHRAIGLNLSIIRSITLDVFEESQIKLLEIAGNERLSNLMIEYNFPKNMTTKNKYSTNLLEYYRQLLRYEDSESSDLPESLGSSITPLASPVKPDPIFALKIQNKEFINIDIDNTKPIISGITRDNNNNRKSSITLLYFYSCINTIYYYITILEIREKLGNLVEKMNICGVYIGLSIIMCFQKILNTYCCQKLMQFNEGIFENLIEKIKNHLGIEAEKEFSKQIKNISNYNQTNYTKQNVNKNEKITKSTNSFNIRQGSEEGTVITVEPPSTSTTSPSFDDKFEMFDNFDKTENNDDGDDFIIIEKNKDEEKNEDNDDDFEFMNKII